MLLTKKKGFKTTQNIKNDIVYSFNKIISQKNPIYFITISNTDISSAEQLRFTLTNKIFNTIHNEYKNTFEVINFLYVIEYPEKVSRGNMMPENCEVHTHIILETTLIPQQIKYYIEINFLNPDIDIIRVDNRNHKMNLIDYVHKQEHILRNNTSNYKININN